MRNVTNSLPKFQNKQISDLKTENRRLSDQIVSNTQIVKDDYEMKLKRQGKEADRVISQLKDDILELKQSNTELLGRLAIETKSYITNKSEFDSILVDLEIRVNNLTNENRALKNEIDRIVNAQINKHQEEKQNLVMNYENNIAQLEAGYGESKNRLTSIISKRDAEIKKLTDQLKEEEKFTGKQKI